MSSRLPKRVSSVSVVETRTVILLQVGRKSGKACRRSGISRSLYEEFAVLPSDLIYFIFVRLSPLLKGAETDVLT